MKLFISIVICQLAGLVGAIFTIPEIYGWYATLNKPAFNPPSWIFGPVWMCLYLLMSLSLFFVWRKAMTKDVKIGLKLFAIQLLLNMLWSLLFFGFQSPLAGLVDIILLFAAILFTMISFFKISRVAAILLIPYLLWVAFASVLNYQIWILNR